jgi:hypothetical protein
LKIVDFNQVKYQEIAKYQSVHVQAVVTPILLFVLLIAHASGLQANVVELLDKGGSSLDGLGDKLVGTSAANFKNKLWKNYGVQIKPYVKSGYTYTSNVYTSQKSKSDHILSFTPGIEIMQKNEYGVVGGFYEGTLDYFAKEANQNTQDQQFSLYANIQPNDAWYLRVRENGIQEGATSGGSSFEPVNRYDNDVKTAIGYVWEDLSFEFSYENFDRDYANTPAKRYDYNEDIYDMRVYGQLGGNIKTYTGVILGDVSFGKDSTRDTFYYEFPLGLEGALPWGFHVDAEVGLHHRNLESAFRNDVTHVVADIVITKALNENKTQTALGFWRRPVESAFSTTTTYDEKMWYVSGSHLITSKLRGRMRVFFSNQDFEERVFSSGRIITGGSVFVANLNQVKRTDNRAGMAIGLDYEVWDWMFLHLDYEYGRRDSNISAFDYTENIISLKSTILL